MRAAPTRFFQLQTLPMRCHGARTKASISARRPLLFVFWLFEPQLEALPPWGWTKIAAKSESSKEASEPHQAFSGIYKVLCLACFKWWRKCRFQQITQDETPGEQRRRASFVLLCHTRCSFSQTLCFFLKIASPTTGETGAFLPPSLFFIFTTGF